MLGASVYKVGVRWVFVGCLFSDTSPCKNECSCSSCTKVGVSVSQFVSHAGVGIPTPMRQNLNGFVNVRVRVCTVRHREMETQ